MPQSTSSLTASSESSSPPLRDSRRSSNRGILGESEPPPPGWTHKEREDLLEALREERRYRRYGPRPNQSPEQQRRIQIYHQELIARENARPVYDEPLQVSRLKSTLKWKPVADPVRYPLIRRWANLGPEELPSKL